MSVSEVVEAKPTLSRVVSHELALKVYIDALLNESSLQPLSQPEKTIDGVVPPVVNLIKKEKPKLTEPPQIRQGDVLGDVDGGLAEFEVLMFQVAGSLTLATPLAKLNGIQRWTDDLRLHPMPGYADWLLGVLPHRDGQIKVIDIAKLVIPETHQARASLNGPRQFKHIVTIGQGEYGLACDELGDVIKLTQKNVRWRHDRHTRPWLAGTVIEQMCALLDIDGFTQMLMRVPYLEND